MRTLLRTNQANQNVLNYFSNDTEIQVLLYYTNYFNVEPVKHTKNVSQYYNLSVFFIKHL